MQRAESMVQLTSLVHLDAVRDLSVATAKVLTSNSTKNEITPLRARVFAAARTYVAALRRLESARAAHMRALIGIACKSCK
jgi:hypothetical protein